MCSSTYRTYDIDRPHSTCVPGTGYGGMARHTTEQPQPPTYVCKQRQISDIGVAWRAIARARHHCSYYAFT